MLHMQAPLLHFRFKPNLFLHHPDCLQDLPQVQPGAAYGAEGWGSKTRWQASDARGMPIYGAQIELEMMLATWAGVVWWARSWK